MKIMKDGSARMEFKPETWAKGYTMRANINPALIPTLKQWNQNSAAVIRAAIRRGGCEAAIAEIESAKWRNQQIRNLSEHHDKIVYNASGEMLYIWDHKRKAMYELLHD